jgi:hypothetical protein
MIVVKKMYIKIIMRKRTRQKKKNYGKKKLRKINLSTGLYVTTVPHGTTYTRRRCRGNGSSATAAAKRGAKNFGRHQVHTRRRLLSLPPPEHARIHVHKVERITRPRVHAPHTNVYNLYVRVNYYVHKEQMFNSRYGGSWLPGDFKYMYVYAACV